MNSRREFLADVGRGMLVASVGPAVALDLGLTPAAAKDGPDRLDFGKSGLSVFHMAGFLPDRNPLASAASSTRSIRLRPRRHRPDDASVWL